MESYIPEYKRQNITPVDFIPDNLEDNDQEVSVESAGIVDVREDDNSLFNLDENKYILFINKQYISVFSKQELKSYLDSNIKKLLDKDIFILKRVEFSFSAFIKE